MLRALLTHTLHRTICLCTWFDLVLLQGTLLSLYLSNQSVPLGAHVNFYRMLQTSSRPCNNVLDSNATLFMCQTCINMSSSEKDEYKL